MSHSELGRYSTTASIFYKVGGLFMKSIPQGAATQVPFIIYTLCRNACMHAFVFCMCCKTWLPHRLALILVQVFCALRADAENCSAWYADCGVSSRCSRDRCGNVVCGVEMYFRVTLSQPERCSCGSSVEVLRGGSSSVDVIRGIP